MQICCGWSVVPGEYVRRNILIPGLDACNAANHNAFTESIASFDLPPLIADSLRHIILNAV